MDYDKTNLTEDFPNRLRELQKEFNYTNEDVAIKIGIPVTTYKNYKKTKTSLKKIDSEILYKLADIFKCTRDYLLGYSKSKNLNRDGREIKQPFYYLQIKEQEELIKFITKDYDLMEALYFLLLNGPEDYTKAFYNLIVSTYNTSKKYVPDKDRIKELGKQNIDIYSEYIIISSSMTDRAMLYLHEGDRYLSNKKNACALKKYLKLILYTRTILSEQDHSYGTLELKLLEELTLKAEEKIANLLELWKRFPPEIKNILTQYGAGKKLYQIRNQKHIDIISNFIEVKKHK